jgi:hypothetical protein
MMEPLPMIQRERKNQKDKNLTLVSKSHNLNRLWLFLLNNLFDYVDNTGYEQNHNVEDYFCLQEPAKSFKKSVHKMKV